MVDRRYADKPVKPRGAVRQQTATPVKGNGRIRAWMARILGAAVLSTMVAGVVQLAITWSAKPVAHVSIEGEFTFIDSEQVAGLVYEALDSSFVRLDLRKIQQHLQQQAWIDYAAVSRRWPDSLEVRIKEHQPIARWGALGVLNQRGEVILLSDSSDLEGLPVLTGPDASSQKVMEQYQALSQLLRKHGLDVKGLQADATLAWTLTLDNDLPIVIGRDQVMEKVGRFLLVYQQQLKQRLGEIERIDVRYSNGVAIGWKQVTEKSLSLYSSSDKQLHTA